MQQIGVTKKNEQYRGATSEDRFQLNKLEGKWIYNEQEHIRICSKAKSFGYSIVIIHQGESTT